MEAAIVHDTDHPASFRDPDGRVVLENGRFFRRLSNDAWNFMNGLFQDGRWDVLRREANLVATEPHHFETPRKGFGQNGLAHETISFQSYPWEWCFELRRQAALCTLRLLQACLSRNLILKDGTSLNVAYHRGRMVWLDVLSITPAQEHGFWDGYGQFCRTQLYPLLIEAYTGLDPRGLLFANPDGIQAEQARQILGLRRMFRPGVFKHVLLQASLERRMNDSGVSGIGQAGQSDPEARPKQATARGLSIPTLQATANTMHNLVKKLPPPPRSTVWQDYEGNTSYAQHDEDAKAAAVDAFLSEKNPESVTDLGCNAGRYSCIAARHAELVLAVDFDPGAIDRLATRSLSDREQERIVPVVADLMAPWAGHGWRNSESQPLLSRLKSDAFVALALVHHLCIARNVPLEAFAELLATIAPSGIVEWVDKTDPMVAYMLKDRRDIFSDFTEIRFANALADRFKTVQRIDISSSRCLFAVHR